MGLLLSSGRGRLPRYRTGDTYPRLWSNRCTNNNRCNRIYCPHPPTRFSGGL